MSNYDVAAYIWPSYHYEPRLEHWWPEKDGEWYAVRRGTPRFPGHDMPRIPLLGCQDEADPAVMRQHVELAREHGINVFIMDWYWYANAPCFERQLNEGLIPALEGTDSKFYLMWANHDASSLWDMHTDERHILWTGQVDRPTLEPMFARLADHYFTLDSYYRIDDRPAFSIFQLPNLIAGLGGLEQTQEAVTWMRQCCRDRGLTGLHLQNIAARGAGVEDGAKLAPDDVEQAAVSIGFDSATSYQFAMSVGGTGDYVHWANSAIRLWDHFADVYPTWYPHVSIGWDNTNRFPSGKEVVRNATPDAFEACLWKARHYLDAHPQQTPLVTINSWNEWTEGSYLLPDMRWGYRYLQAVRNVFV